MFIANRSPSTVTVPPPCEEGAIRLIGSNFTSEGTIQICRNQEWGTVCDDLWSNANAGVVCRQLRLESEGINSHILHACSITSSKSNYVH